MSSLQSSCFCLRASFRPWFCQTARGLEEFQSWGRIREKKNLFLNLRYHFPASENVAKHYWFIICIFCSLWKERGSFVTSEFPGELIACPESPSPHWIPLHHDNFGLHSKCFKNNTFEEICNIYPRQNMIKNLKNSNNIALKNIFIFQWFILYVGDIKWSYEDHSHTAIGHRKRFFGPTSRCWTSSTYLN